MRDTKRTLMEAHILRLESELGVLRGAATALAGEILGLRSRLDLVIDKARPVPRAEGDGDAGRLVCLDEREWDYVRGGIASAPGPPDPVARANARRLDLIERKYKGGGLTPEEQDELNACARAVGDWAFRPERLAERREEQDEFAGWVESMRREVEEKWRARDAGK